MLLKGTYLLASYQNDRDSCTMKELAGSRSVPHLNQDGARCCLCGARFLGSRRHYILNVRRHMKAAHESGEKAAFTPLEHTTGSMQAVLMQLLLQNEHIPAAPNKLSRATAVDLSETEYSQSSLSEFPYIFDYAGKGPNL